MASIIVHVHALDVADTTAAELEALQHDIKDIRGHGQPVPQSKLAALQRLNDSHSAAQAAVKRAASNAGSNADRQAADGAARDLVTKINASKRVYGK